jgi:AAA15 family ATPase/GTPase
MSKVFHHLKIVKFRSLKMLSLSDLGQVNIFVGDNNSGKTSILEAISILCNPLDPFRWIGTSERRLNFGNSSSVGLRPSLEAIKWLFPQENISFADREFQREIEIEADGNISISIKAKLSEVYSAGTEENKQSSLFNLLSDEEENESIAESEDAHLGVELEVQSIFSDDFLLKSEDKARFIFWTNERFVQRKRAKQFVRHATVYPAYSSSDVRSAMRFSQIMREGIKDDLLEVIKLFDQEILDVYYLPDKPSILYIQHQKLGSVPFYTFGDGLKRALIIALALPFAKGGVILIDEIETSIHYSALSKVFTWLIETCRIKNIQLFVTTHSLEAVDAMLEADSEKDEVVAFRLNGDDKQPQRFSGELLQRLRSNRGLDVR